MDVIYIPSLCGDCTILVVSDTLKLSVKLVQISCFRNVIQDISTFIDLHVVKCVTSSGSTEIVEA